MVILGITGSRSFSDQALMHGALAKVIESVGRPKQIVTGDAVGADWQARVWALQHEHIPTLIVPAKWVGDDGKQDRRAGFNRNHLIAAAADKMVSFWDGESLGSAHTLLLCQEMKKGVMVVLFGEAKGKDWKVLLKAAETKLLDRGIIT